MLLQLEDSYYLEAESWVKQYNENATLFKQSNVAIDLDWQGRTLLRPAFYIWVNCINSDTVFVPKFEYQFVYPLSFELFDYAGKHELTNDFKGSMSKNDLAYKLFIYSLFVGDELRTLFKSIIPPHLLSTIEQMADYAHDHELLSTDDRFLEVSKLRRRLYYELNNGQNLKALIDRHIYNGLKRSSLFIYQQQENL